MLLSVNRILCGVGISACLLLGQSALANQIAQFSASPTDPSLADIEMTGAGAGKMLITGPGYQSDGNVATPPGMDVQTPFTIVSAAPSFINLNGSTDFYDASMNFFNLDVSGFATSVPEGPNTLLIQNYSSASDPTFEIDTSISTPGGAQDLLRGYIANATLTGLMGKTASSVLSGNIVYTGGLIYTALLAAGDSPIGGDMSISMVDLTDPTTGNPTGLMIAPDGYIADADAGATGLFDTPVPEPTSLSLLAFALVPLMRRARP
jgi:hypothetical protein